MKLRLIACLLLGSAAPAFAATDTMVFEGEASSPQGDPLYREQHALVGSCENGYWQPASQQVRYFRPGDDSPFAEKALSYPASLLRPAVDFQQPEFEERLQVSFTGDKSLNIDWALGEEPSQSWTQPINPELVIDAGFDHFIRANWTTLTQGGSAGFDFLAATRGETFRFVAEPASDDIAGADLTLQIRPSGVLMRMLVDPIRLGYSRDGLLTHYSGLGNIRRNSDENYRVAIRYQLTDPPDCPLLPVNG